MRVHRRRAVLVVAGACLAVHGSVTVAGAATYPPVGEPGAQITPTRVQAGGCATFSGQGFAARTSILVADDGASRGTTTTADDGTFAKEVCFASEAKKGRHDITGTGTSAAGVTTTVTASIVVTGGASNRPEEQAATDGQQPSGGGADGSSVGTGGAGSGDDGGSAAAPAPAGGASQAGQAGRVVRSRVVTTASEPYSGVGSISAFTLGLLALALGALLLLLLDRRRRERRAEPDA